MGLYESLVELQNEYSRKSSVVVRGDIKAQVGGNLAGYYPKERWKRSYWKSHTVME